MARCGVWPQPGFRTELRVPFLGGLPDLPVVQTAGFTDTGSWYAVDTVWFVSIQYSTVSLCFLYWYVTTVGLVVHKSLEGRAKW